MALWNYDPSHISAPWHNRSWALGHQLDRHLDSFFDHSSMLQIRDHAARLTIDKQGQLKYEIDVSGYHPQELKVDVIDNELMVQGEYKEQNGSETIHRQFVRRLLIPEGIQKESIKCDINEKGRLCITGQQVMAESAKRSIPIDHKQQQAIQQGQKK